MKRFFFILCTLLAFSCAPKKQAKASDSPQSREFILPTLPAVITEPEQRLDYLVKHYWDNFFAGDWSTDSSVIRGVKIEDVEQSFSNYTALLMDLSMEEAQQQIAGLFSKIEQSADSLLYIQMTDVVSKYLYDPNSPLRSEDLYLPFVEGLVNSPMTKPEMLPAYRFELKMCKLNPYGSKVPDFAFKDASGKVGRLYDIDAEYVMLFFSNPGCQACRTIIDQIASREYINPMISGGQLAILNIYIDTELNKWREYVGSYPANWINAYDFQQLINIEKIYYVRAIPSLYLLDSQKRVIDKDAPIERVLEFFDNIYYTALPD